MHFIHQKNAPFLFFHMTRDATDPIGVDESRIECVHFRKTERRSCGHEVHQIHSGSCFTGIRWGLQPGTAPAGRPGSCGRDGGDGEPRRYRFHGFHGRCRHHRSYRCYGCGGGSGRFGRAGRGQEVAGGRRVPSPVAWVARAWRLNRKGSGGGNAPWAARRRDPEADTR